FGYADKEKTLENGLAKLQGLLQEESELSADIEAAGGEGNAPELVAKLDRVVKGIADLEGIGVTEANEKMVSLQRKFAKAHTDDNLEADMNNIEYQTVSLYYGVLQAEENLKVCEDNLELQKKLLKNVELKYSVGSATALEVKAQKAAVTSAEQDVNTAKSGAEKAKMNFNMLLGFDIETNLVLTDALTPKGKPEIDLDKAVKDALKNRLSVAQLEYACEIQKIALDQLSGKPGYSEQRAALKITELAYDNMPNTIEIEIRSAYIDLQDKYNTVLESQETVAMAKESLRVAELMYEVGMNTSADVQKAQMTAKQANQLLMASISDYNLACYAFDYMTGVGKDRIEL
ncbi:MAG: TolC family protein, partial [Firmicutes bacterium]|nr:TolC family protein [Bacillota bacterium]